MNLNVFYGILIPFIGTSAGAACVFFMKKDLNQWVQRCLTGFAAGVMVAASVWSLLIPALEQSEGMGKLSFVPAAVGFWAGVLFLLLLDHIIPHLHQQTDKAEGPKSRLQKTTMLILAVTLHNIPEGMAVGVVYAGYLAGNAKKVGDYFAAKLEKLPHVKEVRHQGLLVGVEFDDTIGGVDVKHGCLDRHLLITAIGAHIIRMIPPLIVTEEECDKAVAIIEDTIKSLEK